MSRPKGAAVSPHFDITGGFSKAQSLLVDLSHQLHSDVLLLPSDNLKAKTSDNLTSVPAAMQLSVILNVYLLFFTGVYRG